MKSQFVVLCYGHPRKLNAEDALSPVTGLLLRLQLKEDGTADSAKTPAAGPAAEGSQQQGDVRDRLTPQAYKTTVRTLVIFPRVKRKTRDLYQPRILSVL